MRPIAASLCLLLVTIIATACGGSSSGTASQPAVTAPPTATATTTPAPTTYRTQLERDLAHAFSAALLATPAAPTESQVPPRINLLVREPPTVCERLRSAAYRCRLDYQLPKGPPMRVRYTVRRDGSCFTATAAAIGTGSTLHRLVNC